MTATGKRTYDASKQRPRRNAASRLAACAVNAMTERKARDIVVMDLRNAQGAVADFFVIGTGGSDRQIRAVANAVDEHIEEVAGEQPWHREGFEHLQWVLLDYVDLVVHLFSEEKRAYYDLERLWGDAGIERVPADGDAGDVPMLQHTADERAEA